MKRSFRILILGYVVICGVGFTGPSAANTLATPKGESEVRRITVKLSDVFNGVPDEIDRDIAQAPAPCRHAVYDVNVLTRLAQKYRLDWEPQSLADHVVISSACTKITSDNMRDAVVQKIKDEGTKGDIDVVFDNRTLEIDLPVDETADFNLNDFLYDAQSKRFRADVVAQSASGPVALPIAGRITIKQNVPVLAHRLESGMVISASDIEWMAVPEEHINASVVMDSKDLVGRELRHDTSGSEILHSNDVIPQRYVSRGSLITLKIETPYMSLAAQGKALQDGTEGDVVRVLNTQSNRTVEGVVEGPGVVRIQTVQKFAAVQ